MADEFSDFLADPTGATFLRLREWLLASPGYDFHSGAVDGLQELVNSGQFDDVPDMVSELMPGWLLSLASTSSAGYAAQQAGDPAGAAREGYLAKACLRGLLQSGDGSRERPYRVTHIADEYDVLRYLGKESAEQRVVQDDGGAFDVIGCADGSELWFDVSASLSQR